MSAKAVLLRKWQHILIARSEFLVWYETLIMISKTVNVSSNDNCSITIRIRKSDLSLKTDYTDRDDRDNDVWPF